MLNATHFGVDLSCSISLGKNVKNIRNFKDKMLFVNNTPYLDIPAA